MNFTDFFIKRPVLAIVVSLLIALIGAIAYTKLPLRQFPKISPTVITVTTSYPGASAQLIEGFITTPLENALGGTDGLDYVVSESRHGLSEITLHFKLGYDIHKAVTDVGDKVNSVRWRLPEEAKDPVIEKQDPNADVTMYIVFQSQKRSTEAIYDFLERQVQTQLETLPGVGKVRIFGDRRYAMRIWLNPKQMAAQDISAGDVATMLEKNNARTPTGRIGSEETEYEIRAATDLHKAEQFDQLALKTQNGHVTRISDIGYAALGSANNRVSVNFNGKKGVVIGIIPQAGANPLEISQHIKKQLKQIKQSMPEDMSANLLWDDSKFIQASIHEVQETLIEAIVFVLIVIFLFLGSIRTLSIPAVTIPLSIIGAWGLMYWWGFSLNTMTFLSFVLAIGMVVDDAIVVAENIHRHVESGKTPYQAALVGAREIQFAVIVITLTLAAVFAPIGFMTGIIGSLFKEFAFTLAGAVIISGIIALTLSPMMCSKILTTPQGERPLEKLIYNFTYRLAEAYRTGLIAVLSIRWVVILGLVLVLSLAVWVYNALPQTLAPKEDQGLVITVVDGPASANLDYTEYYTRQLAEIYKEIPEIINYGMINGIPDGVHTALSFAILETWAQRARSVSDILDQLRAKTFMIPGVIMFPLNPYNLPGIGERRPIQLALQSTGSYVELEKKAKKLVNAAKRHPGLINVDTNLKIDKPILKVDINRKIAADLGVPMQEIGNTLNIAFGELDTGRFSLNGRSYDVIPQLAPQYRNTPDAIRELYVRTQNNDLIPFSTLSTVKTQVEPRFLPHFQQLRSARLEASIKPEYSLDNALNYLKAQAEKIKSPDMKVDFGGLSRKFLQAQGTMQQTFLFALLFIFLVLAAQFESFRDPFIILFTVPLSTTGGLALLKLTGGSLNIYTQIGFVTLIGLISKHGILMVDFANELQRDGASRIEAIIEAAVLRLRPILMTTAAMILSAVPLAFAQGAGAYSRQQMGWVIIGGMLFGTLLTLFVIPTIYSYIGSRKPAQTA